MLAPKLTDGVGKPQARSMSNSTHDAASLDALFAGLADLDAQSLRLQWRNHLGGTPPAHLSRWLLVRVFAYRVQALVLGDLDCGLFGNQVAGAVRMPLVARSRRAIPRRGMALA
jgi:hypothetical protein